MNPVINMLMQKLQKTNPQGYSMINQMMKNNGNPEAAVKQILGNVPPDQRQQLLNAARSYGTPDNILSQLQNMK